MYYLDIVDKFKTINAVSRVGTTVNISGDLYDDDDLKIISFTYKHVGVAKAVQQKINDNFVERIIVQDN